MITKPIPWSFSRLNDLETCPRKFHETHIRKSVPFDETSPHLIEGKNRHLQLAKAVRAIELDMPVPDREGIENTLPIIYSLVKKAQSVGGSHIMTEQQLAFKRDLTLTPWFSDEVWVRVIWDFAVIIGDYAIILDWKTGKKWPDNGQLKLFAGSLFARFPFIKKVDTAYIYFKVKEKETKTYRIEQFKEIWDSLAKRADVMNIRYASNDWEPTPNPFCNFCKVTCEYAGKRHGST